MKHPTITIIGMGPRGLSILERIAAWSHGTPCRLQLNLIEPNECGPGVHAPRQPQHLLLNTPAGQVTMFPAPGSVATAPACATPSLAEWARAQGLRRFGARFHQVDADCAGGAEIADTDFLPRQLLGQYLAWAFAAAAAALPAAVSWRHLRHRAFDMYQQPDGSFVVELENGYQVPSDYVFITTGHSRNNLTDEEAWYRKFAQDHARYNSRLAFLRHVYPLEQLVAIGGDASVALAGIGLTAYDVIAELTVGRGGRYQGAGAGLRYLPGGREPKLLLFSRSCLPPAARAISEQGLAHSHQARFFTREAVRRLRAEALRARGSHQLDFERELLPLLLREMGFAWHSAQAGAAPDPDSYQLGETERAAIDALLFPLRGRQFAGPAEFAECFAAMMAEDLCQARLGNPGSPAKACADVLGDVRAVLQDVVEHAGLTPSSHRKFLSVYHPAINRITFGPPAMRNEQLLALMRAGVLSVAAGPGTAVRIDEERSQFALHSRSAGGNVVQHADALVIARLDVYSPETDDTPFSRNLLRRGTIRPYYNGTFHPGGLDIDRANHPRDRSGRICPNLWAVGWLAEGAHYYTDALPRPQLHSRQVLDAERCVAELFGMMASGGAAPMRRKSDLVCDVGPAGSEPAMVPAAAALPKLH